MNGNFPLFAQSALQTVIVLIALCLVIGWMLLRTYRRLDRLKRNDSRSAESIRTQRVDRGHHSDAPPEVLRWEVQMHETARELSAQLDSKMRALQALIAEADRAAGRLEAATGAAGTDEPAVSAEHHREEIYTLADYGFDTATIASRLGAPVDEVEMVLRWRQKKAKP